MHNWINHSYVACLEKLFTENHFSSNPHKNHFVHIIWYKNLLPPIACRFYLHLQKSGTEKYRLINTKYDVNLLRCLDIYPAISNNFDHSISSILRSFMQAIAFSVPFSCANCTLHFEIVYFFFTLKPSFLDSAETKHILIHRFNALKESFVPSECLCNLNRK